MTYPTTQYAPQSPQSNSVALALADLLAGNRQLFDQGGITELGFITFTPDHAAIPRPLPPHPFRTGRCHEFTLTSRHCDAAQNGHRPAVNRGQARPPTETAPPRPQICPTAHATGAVDRGYRGPLRKRKKSYASAAGRTLTRRRPIRTQIPVADRFHFATEFRNVGCQ